MIFQKLVNIERLTHEIRQSSITTALDSISAAGTTCEVLFKAELSTADEAALNLIITRHIPVPLPNTNVQTVINIGEKVSPSGRTEVSVYEPEGLAATIVTHNFCDKTTWWQTALPVALETLTPVSVDGVASTTIFNASHTFIIDLAHGKMYDEDKATLADPTLLAKIYVDDVLVTTGYNLNYETGVVTFSAPISGVIKASYKYAVNSYFILKPKLGRVLSIINAQAQFSTDSAVSSPIVFEVWVNHPTYGMISIPSTRITYKNEKDFIASCNGGEQVISGWGNYPLTTRVLCFDYARPKPLRSEDNVEIRIYTKDHAELTGSLTNATFYVSCEAE